MSRIGSAPSSLRNFGFLYFATALYNDVPALSWDGYWLHTLVALELNYRAVDLFYSVSVTHVIG
jgi:hypothetical protein